MEEAYLTIGPVSFRLLADLPIRFHETCDNFSHVDKSLLQPDVVDCTIKLTDKPTALEGRLIRQTATRAIFEHDGLELRVNLFNGMPTGIYKELDEHHVEVEIPNGGQQEITISTGFLELLALERHILRLNALVLHSSLHLAVRGNPLRQGSGKNMKTWRLSTGTVPSSTWRGTGSTARDCLSAVRPRFTSTGKCLWVPSCLLSNGRTTSPSR